MRNGDAPTGRRVERDRVGGLEVAHDQDPRRPEPAVRRFHTQQFGEDLSPDASDVVGSLP